MFPKDVYIERRNNLKKLVKSGLILFLGNDESPMNYKANVFKFRQDSSFLYFWGIDEPNFAALIDIDNNVDSLIGDDLEIDDIVWMGSQEKISSKMEKTGVNSTFSNNKLPELITASIKKGRPVHFIPQYRPENKLKLEKLFGINNEYINNYASEILIKSIISLREIKSDLEISEIESALEVSYLMYTEAMKRTKPNMIEKEICGLIEGIAHSKGYGISFPIIFSIHGETLHNPYHFNEMKSGALVVLDSGVESKLHYASDITRTFPVNGKFSPIQKDLYELVLKAQMEAIKMIKPDLEYKKVHLATAKIFAEGLKQLGFLKGNPEDIVSNGAHALFFPHGLGHMMGLDVHDMENLGENFIGYTDDLKRSDQFGLGYLRLAKKLKPGFVLTVEPGLYFIPELIEYWKNQNKFTEYINYEKAEQYKTFGGIRIEDDILVTNDSYKVLGKPIPKTVSEIESIMK